MKEKEHDKGKKNTGEMQQEEHPKKKMKEKDELVETLEKSLEEKENALKKLEEDMLYLRAEFDNFKRLKAKERLDTLKFGNETLIKELFPVVDNLERALDHASQTEDVKGILEGVQLTLNELSKVLEKNGVTRIDALGKTFDPTVHEAYLQETRDDVEPDTVVSEFQKGYLLNGRLLRPAVVSVSKQSEA
jgi:molecular chaperone GrpE